MSANKIMYIFIYQGIFLGIVGIIFGLILGVLLSLNLDIVVSFIENILGRSILDSDIYMISDVPAKLEFLDLIYVSIISFFFAVLATIYPAVKASKTMPAEVLKGN